MRLISIIRNNEYYNLARRAILKLLTASQSQHDRRTQTIIIDPIDRTNVILTTVLGEPMNPLPAIPKTLQSKLILHYKHERRVCLYKRDVHQIWSKTFDHTPLPPTKLIVGHRNHSHLKTELIHKKPRLLSYLKS